MTARLKYTERQTKQSSRDSYNKYMRERAAKMRILLNKEKDHPCMDCKQKFPPYAMDFDHVRGEKIYSIGRLTTSSKSWKTIQTEIAKCELVCANCHRIRSFNRGQMVPKMAQREAV